MDAGNRRGKLKGEYNWDTCPEPIKNLVLKIVENYRSILGDNLTGVYLHGSLAMGCFNPQRSDIDILAMTNESLSVETKKKIIEFLFSIKDKAPTKGIEMSIVLERYVRDYVYPTPFELHYSPAWDKKYRDGEVDFLEEKTDEDLVAHAMITRERGVCLFGKPVSEVFGKVPQDYYRQSLLSDARWMLERLKTEDPVYIVLNFCRILAFTKDGFITSKKEGGQWGLGNLSERYRILISQSMQVYSGMRDEEHLDTRSLASFIQYMKRELGLS